MKAQNLSLGSCNMATGAAMPANAHVRSFYMFVLLIFFPLFSSLLTSFPSVTNAASIPAVGSSWRTGGENTINFSDGSTVNPILVSNSTKSGPSFACGFFSHPGVFNGHLFSVFLVYYNGSGISNTTKPQVVWSANRDTPVTGGNATLRLLAGGGLRLLDDTHGGLVWFSNTYNRSVAYMNLTEEGNLVLWDDKNHKVWQSYEHPTDTAVVGQNIAGRKLTSNMSFTTNPSNGHSISYRFSLTFSNSSYMAYIAGSEPPPQMYYNWSGTEHKGGVWLPLPSATPQDDSEESPSKGTDSPLTKKFVRLESNGHLSQYKWQYDPPEWEKIYDDVLKDDYREKCKFPMVCGMYGVCRKGECSCLSNQYFQARDPSILSEGCERVKQWSCEKPTQFVHYENISYFAYVQEADIPNTDVQRCKDACLKNCSCEAAFFKYRSNPSFDVQGDCYLPSRVYSLIHNNAAESNFSSSAFIKVVGGSSRRRWPLPIVISISFICVLLMLFGFVLYKKRHMLRQEANGDHPEGYNGDNDSELFKFDHLPGMPTRFSFDELRDATDGFSKKLGEGGFGAVFRGTLRDGNQVAVKILGYRGQGMKEFLAEVVTIGSIHHHNLVRLVGYCAERLHRFLVYEYQSNGSLDKWIFHDEKAGSDSTLDFGTKQKIILDVARGLSYLHEDCRNKIMHLDIKPQNILLDAGFNAKVSDFGLSKLIDRDQSEVFTTLRGTPGYLAPEWLNSAITEKVDVYSFGVVVLEMVSGKRIFDYSQSRGSTYLVRRLIKSTEEGRLLDMIGVRGVDEEEALKLVKIATWCLQEDFTKRPSMSTVVKVLEGLIDMEPMLEGLWISSSAPPFSTASSDAGESSMSTPAPLLVSTVSGPR